MIHYHNAAGGDKSCVSFLTGRHAIVSFAYPSMVPMVAELCQSFCLDNGAYTAWKKGKQMDFSGYVDWVEQWSRHPGFDFALIPDVIDGGESENDSLIEDWPQYISAVPVWHMHESMRRLERLCSDWRMVAIGSSGLWPTPGTSTWWDRMTDIMNMICDDQGRPPCKLHGLRMLNPEIFRHLPFSSADSSNAIINAGSLNRFGTYLPPSKGQRAEIIASRIEAVNAAPCWIKKPVQQKF